MKNSNKKIEKIFRALANQKRIRIIEILRKQKMSPGDLSEKLNLSYKATYNHIRKLEELGFLQKERHHNSVLYWIDKTANRDIRSLLNLIK